MLSPFTTAKALSAQCGLSPSSVRRYMDEIERCDRYKGQKVTANTTGTRMVNVLVWDDYLVYRAQMENGLGKHIPPYDPKVVRRWRGE